MSKENTLKEIKEILTTFPKEVYFISVSYDGSGDSGDFQDVYYEDKDRQLIRFTVLPSNEEESLINKLYDLLEYDYGGWEINDGACGSFNIDVKNKIVNHEHNSRFTDYDTSQQQYNIRHP
jgi:hypothetical protein